MKKKTLQKLIYDGILDSHGRPKVVVAEESKKQIHLNITKRLNILKGIKFSFPKGLIKESKALVEIFINISSLGIVAGLSLFLVLFLLPFPESMELVWIIKHNVVLGIVIMFIGSGAGLYILYDFISLIKDKKEKE